jgi:lipopolysaccharide biosynthesis glycosyltransferase
MQVDLTLTQVRLPDKVDAIRLRQFGRASLFKLLIPELFADRDLVIYLDSDLVANGLDISELAIAAPRNAAISAAIDPHIAITALHATAVAQMGLDPASYVNSGVLALRPKLLTEDLLESFLAFSLSNPNAIHPDQDFLNSHFNGRIHVLNEKFNYPVSVYQQSMIQPLPHYWDKILHYSGSIKPLDGFIATGIIPFWVHAQRVPEAAGALVGKATKYLFPVEGNPETLVVHEIEYAAPSP